ncbi:pseudouridine synthase [Bacillus massilinigeriensis]|uniref:pseudouridine synthase n=1 Tax=Bacillus mediterraneensis TaxID=1805474 RepID=UPI0008F9423B|nr:pseudouridine synthase [Bacillus mediterraneensis]
MRLDKILANAGFGSRKEVRKLFKNGSVAVNGKSVKDAGKHADPFADEITVSGETVRYREYIYLMMNKPPGVVSATEDNFEETVVDLLEFEDALFQPFPVGRLDKDTEGLLLITNDGALAHKLLSPKKHVPKTYFALIDKQVTQGDIEAFRNGVTLDDGYSTKPGDLRILTEGMPSKILLTITEGKFHQVKRMFRSVGKNVLFLKRVSMGPLSLDDTLQPGEYRELTEEELELLQKLG